MRRSAPRLYWRLATSYEFIVALALLANSSEVVATCLSFNGTNAYVNMAAIDLSASNTFTLEAWIKPRSLTNQMYSDVVRQSLDSYHTSWALSFEAHGTILNFGLNASADAFNYWEFHVPIIPGDYVDGNWHHLAVVYDGVSRRIYKDGVLIGVLTSPGNTIFFSGGSFDLASNPSDPTGFFDGQIDEVRLWNVARTAEQIDRYLNQSLVGKEPGLVAFWPLNDGAGIVAGDSTGHGHGGTLVNGPVWVPEGAPVQPATGRPYVQTDYAASLTANSSTLYGLANSLGQLGSAWFEYGTNTLYGMRTSGYDLGGGANDVPLAAPVSNLVAGQIYHWRVVATNSQGASYGLDKCFPTVAETIRASLNFDKAADSLRTQPLNLSRSPGLTLEAWFKPFDLTNSACADIVRQQSPGSPADFSLTFRGHGSLLGFGLTTGGDFQELLADISSQGIVPETWHHVAATYDGTVKKLYLDGLLLNTIGQTGAIAFSWAATNNIGSSGGVSGFYNGLLDEVRVLSVARSGAELNQYLGQSLFGNEAGLLAYWRLDDGVGNVALDSSAHGYTGFLFGPSWVNENAPLTTLSGPPVAFTGPVLNQTTNSAVVSGNVSSSGLPTTAFFQFGSDTNYGSRTPSVATGNSSSPVLLTNLLSGFAPAQYGHYRLVAANSVGTNHGADRFFCTAGAGAGFAVNFDGGQQVFVPPYVLSNLNDSNQMTFEAWIKPGDISSPNGCTIFSQAQGIFVGFTNFGATLRFGLTGAGQNAVPPWGSFSQLDVPVDAADYTDGNWHHIAAVYDGTNQFLYKDGTLLGSTNLSGNVSFYGTNSITIGDGDYFTGPFSGQLDELRLWRVARTHDQIKQFMNMTLWSLRDGLLAYWRCDEGSGGIIGDATGHGSDLQTALEPLDWVVSTAPINAVPKLTAFASNVTSNSASLNGNASPMGLPTTAHFEYGLTTGYGSQTVETAIGAGTAPVRVSAAIADLSPGTPYHFRLMVTNAAGLREGGDQVFVTAGQSAGTALNLSGQSLYRFVSLPSFPYITATNAFTIEAWLLPSNLTSQARSPVFNTWDLYTPMFFIAFQNYGSNLNFGLTTSNGYQELSVPIPAPGFADGSWHHLAATYDGVTKRLLVDGVLAGAADQPGGFVLRPGYASIFIGEVLNPGGTTADLLFGQVDELRVWNAARTAAEIKKFMNQSLMGSEPGLAAYYRFDQGDEGPLADSAAIEESLSTYFSPVYSPLWVTSSAPIFGTLAPWLISVAPTHAPVGASVLITGGNLVGATKVAFNGTPAAFTTNTDGSITSSVPLGATSGSIVVSSTYGQAASLIPFVVDGPSVAFTSPQNATFVTGLPFIRGTVSEAPAGNGVIGVTLSVQRATDSLFWTGSGWGSAMALPAALSGNLWNLNSSLPSGGDLPDGGYQLSATATDSSGYSNRATIGVSVSLAGSPSPATLLPNGHVLLRFPGLAGATYHLQISSDLLSWTDLATITVDGGGVLSYEDASPAFNRARFFRILPF